MTATTIVARLGRRLGNLGASGWFGLVLVVCLLGIAFVCPLLAGNPSAVVGAPLEPFSRAHPLGTDLVGRDLLARILAGGWTLVLSALVTTALAYAVAVPLGLIAAVRRGWSDNLITRAADVGLAVPPLILLLVLVASLSPGMFVVVIAIAAAEVPGLIRITRAAAVEVSVLSFVESARLRGMGPWVVAFREVLPNILPTMLTDLGFRFTISILSIAAANYLGLGLQPPAADWGLMVSENQAALQIDAWPVVIPGLMVVLLTIGGNLLVDALMYERPGDLPDEIEMTIGGLLPGDQRE